MQTAIVVYESTNVTISTNECGLQMRSMDNQLVSLSTPHHTQSLIPGIYKIVSTQVVGIAGNESLIETATTNTKSDVPTLPFKATQSFPPLSAQSWNAFFATPDAKTLSGV
jgi:hypothetical protein